MKIPLLFNVRNPYLQDALSFVGNVMNIGIFVYLSDQKLEELCHVMYLYVNVPVASR